MHYSVASVWFPGQRTCFWLHLLCPHPEGCSGGRGLVHHISFPADTWIPIAPNIWVGPSDSCCPLMRMEGMSTVSRWPSKMSGDSLAVGQMQRILGMILRSHRKKNHRMDERNVAPWLITWKAVWTQQEGHEENAKLLCKATDIWGLFVMEARSNPSN